MTLPDKIVTKLQLFKRNQPKFAVLEKEALYLICTYRHF